ncbi:MAG TPA: hypothetical protein VM689_16395 [Aliidongia sp.]|nr:hypothetical protein [Aliidongia sp.]
MQRCFAFILGVLLAATASADVAPDCAKVLHLGHYASLIRSAVL